MPMQARPYISISMGIGVLACYACIGIQYIYLGRDVLLHSAAAGIGKLYDIEASFGNRAAV